MIGIVTGIATGIIAEIWDIYHVFILKPRKIIIPQIHHSFRNLGNLLIGSIQYIRIIAIFKIPLNLYFLHKVSSYLAWT